MDVGDICTRSVISARADETLVVAAQRMRRFHVGDLVVLDPSEARPVPIGMLTDRDITVGVIAEAAGDIAHLTCAEVMRGPVFTIEETDDVFAAVDQMSGAGVRRLPVVDETGELVGILSLDDVLRVVAETLRKLATVSRTQRDEEWEARP